MLIEDGSWSHTAPRQRWAVEMDLGELLIGEPSRAAHHAFGPGELWGVRRQESTGRAHLYATSLARTPSCDCCTSTRQRTQAHGGVIHRANGTVAYGPIWDWGTDEVWAYLSRNHIRPNPVYEKLCQVGAPEHFLRVSHMISAGRITEGRITWLRRGWPGLFEDLCGRLPRLREYV